MTRPPWLPRLAPLWCPGGAAVVSVTGAGPPRSCRSWLAGAGGRTEPAAGPAGHAATGGSVALLMAKKKPKRGRRHKQGRKGNTRRGEHARSSSRAGAGSRSGEKAEPSPRQAAPKRREKPSPAHGSPPVRRPLKAACRPVHPLGSVGNLPRPSGGPARPPRHGQSPTQPRGHRQTWRTTAEQQAWRMVYL